MLQDDTACFCDAVLSSSLLILAGIDLQGRFTAVSAGWERMFGYDAETLLNRSVGEYVSDASAWESFLERLLEADEGAETFVFRSKNGQDVRCELTTSPWFHAEHGRRGFILVGRDLAVWDKFQDDLVRIDRLAEMGRMSAGIVHDLKNPLSIINQASGWAGVVVEDAKGLTQEDRSELSHTLKEIEEQTSRCRRITDQILEFVRETKPETIEFDLKELIRETVRYLQPEISYPPIEIVYRFEETAPLTVATDFKLLQQVCVNLLSNAIYAIREKEDGKGRIEIGIDDEAERVILSIQDDGPGIPRDVQERIFDLFYTTKPAGKGTGLGLPICRNIMRRLGGDLSFQSQVGSGTQFFVAIPQMKQSS